MAHRLIEGVAGRFEERPGGYTRLIRLAQRRLGDATPLAILQLVGNEEAPGAVAKPGKSARRRKADARYALAVKSSKARSSEKPTAAAEPEAQPDAGEDVRDGDDA